MTVKFVAADDSTTTLGAYALSLPVGAPLFGTYSATLPIALLAQTDAVATPDVAGRYTVEASATGYQTQSVSGVNISAASVSQNFTLVP